MEVKQKEEMLLFVGIKVPPQQIEEAYHILEKMEHFNSLLQKKQKCTTKTNEDQFIHFIKNQHEKIIEEVDKSEIIQKRDSTITIRAINPTQIKSLTERAFFNSFNLQRNALNDLNQEQNRDFQLREQMKNPGEQFPKRRAEDEEEEEKCICGKIIPGSEWVQCCNEDKCRGSNWYHIECAGFNTKDLQNLKEKDFFCEYCRRDARDEDSANSSRKKRKND